MKTAEPPKEIEVEIVNPEAIALLDQVPDAKQELQTAFASPFIEAEKLKEEAMAIRVTDPEQVEDIARARELRLQLRKIRVDAEHTRKELKEESLRKGKAIDGFANILKHLIVPMERHLQEQEDYAKRIEAERLTKLGEDRMEQLRKFDPESWNDYSSVGTLAEMENGVFDALLTGTKAKAKAAAEEAKAIEEARKVKEKADKEERERVAKENERLKREAEEQAKKAEAERIEREKAEAAREKKEAAERKAREEAEAKAEAERQKEAAKVQAKLDAEAKAREEAEAKLKAERDRQAEIEEQAIRAKAEELRAKEKAEQAALAAPDKEKLKEMAEWIRSLNMPTLKSKAAKDIGVTAGAKLKELADWMDAETDKIK